MNAPGASKTHSTLPWLMAVIGMGSGLMAGWLYFADASERSSVKSVVSKHSLTVEPQQIDLGVIQSDALQKVSFALSNDSEHLVDSLVVNESCGCTVANSDVTEIGPGEQTTLNVEFNPRGREGPSAVHVLVDYRLAGIRQQALLTITSEIVGARPAQ